MPADRALFVYTRTTATATLLVIANMSDTAVTERPSLAVEGPFETLLGNYEQTPDFANLQGLRPYEAIIYQK